MIIPSKLYMALMPLHDTDDLIRQNSLDVNQDFGR